MDAMFGIVKSGIILAGLSTIVILFVAIVYKVSVLDQVHLLADIALTGSFIVLAYQVYLERKEVRNNIYEKLRSDFAQASLFLAGHPNIAKYVNGNQSTQKNLSDEDIVYFYLDAMIGLFERTWRMTKNDEWDQWGKWLDKLRKSELFQKVWKESKNSYDDNFREMLDDRYATDEPSKDIRKSPI